jgi:hypothetical protein
MTHRLQISFAVLLGIFAMSGTMFAHHGTGAAYDYMYRITTSATVTSFVWANPHGQLYFDIKNDKGEVQNWGVELNNPGNLTRLGWSKNTFKTGDQILVTFVPAKEDRPFGGCGIFVAPDGMMYHNGQACGAGITDLSKLPVKPGYTAVEVKFPVDTKGQQAQEQ